MQTSANIQNEAVYYQSDVNYYLFWQQLNANTFGWYIDQDFSKVDAANFQPSGTGTHFYQHDDLGLFQSTIQLCPYQVSQTEEYSWQVSTEDPNTGSYTYKHLDTANITMTTNCVNAGDTETASIEELASNVKDCNSYGIDPAIVTDIENSYQQIFDSFDVNLSPLGDTPFWLCLACHGLSIVFFVWMGVWPIVRTSGRALDPEVDL